MRAPRDFGILLPPEWVRIPFDGRENERIAVLVQQRVAELPVGSRAGARRQLTSDLGAATRRARDVGGVDLMISLGRRGPLPLAAICLVTFLDGDNRPGAGELAEQFADDADEIGLVEVGGETAVRRLRRREHAALVFADMGPMPFGQPIPETLGHTTQLDFAIPLPGTTGVLMFTFATPLDELAPAMLQLFDAMASSIRFLS